MIAESVLGFTRSMRSDSLLLVICEEEERMTRSLSAGSSRACDCGYRGRSIDTGGRAALPGRDLHSRKLVSPLP